MYDVAVTAKLETDNLIEYGVKSCFGFSFRNRLKGHLQNLGLGYRKWSRDLRVGLGP